MNCRLPLIPLLLLPVLAVAGCRASRPSDVVTGKVTWKGKPVAGTVAFAAGGKEVVAPINPDGTYTIKGSPAGKVRVTVKGFPGPIASVRRHKKLPPMPGVFSNPTTGVPPPARYATPAGALTFEVTGGSQTFDIALNP